MAMKDHVELVLECKFNEGIHQANNMLRAHPLVGGAHAEGFLGTRVPDPNNHGVWFSIAATPFPRYGWSSCTGLACCSSGESRRGSCE